jgi:hypothetical protein
MSSYDMSSGDMSDQGDALVNKKNGLESVAQSRSKMPAAPMPPPMHMVTMP